MIWHNLYLNERLRLCDLLLDKPPVLFTDVKLCIKSCQDPPCMAVFKDKETVTSCTFLSSASHVIEELAVEESTRL